MRDSDQIDQLRVGDLSAHFNPWLKHFMKEALRCGGEATALRDREVVRGVWVYHRAEDVGSIFTRDPTLAIALLERMRRVTVFSEIRLRASSEVFHIYEADLSRWRGDHRFAHRVRMARPTDTPSILALMREVYGRVEEPWILSNPPIQEKGFVVEVGARLAGVAWVTVLGEHARLHSLSVGPRFRRLGIGRDLWFARVLWAREAQASQIISEISEENVASQAITEAGGMQRVGQWYRCYPS